MANWSDVVEWRRDGLAAQEEPMRNRRKQLIDAYAKLQSMERQISSKGKTVNAIVSMLQHFQTRVSRQINDVSELMMATAEMADGVWSIQTQITECNQAAKIHGLRISKGGQLVSESCHDADEFESAADELEPMIMGVLAKADKIDAAYNKRLTALANGSYHSSERGSSTSPGLPDLPQKGWTIGENTAWWSSLTEEEKKAVVRAHPGLIGNRNGIPMEWRDKANRARLPGEIAAMKKKVAEEKAIIERNEREGLPSSHEKYNLYKKKLNDLEELQKVLKKYDSKISSESSPDRQRLIYLDSKTSTRVQAGIALGDVDHAKNVQMVIPGMNNTVGNNMDGLIGDAQRVRDSTYEESKKHSSSAGIHTRGDIATVAWMYRTPQNLEVTTTDLAEKAAPKIASYMEGVQASRQATGVGNAEIDVGGHSFGSTTAGMAVDRVRVGTVHNLALYGSPGSGVQDVREYNIDGKAYVSGVNTNDSVQGIGPDDSFGKNPMKMRGFTHLANNPENDSECETFVSEGGAAHFCEKGDTNLFRRHSEYLNKGTGSLKDIARIMGGMEPEGEK